MHQQPFPGKVHMIPAQVSPSPRRPGPCQLHKRVPFHRPGSACCTRPFRSPPALVPRQKAPGHPFHRFRLARLPLTQGDTGRNRHIPQTGNPSIPPAKLQGIHPGDLPQTHMKARGHTRLEPPLKHMLTGPLPPAGPHIQSGTDTGRIGRLSLKIHPEPAALRVELIAAVAVDPHPPVYIADHQVHQPAPVQIPPRRPAREARLAKPPLLSPRTTASSPLPSQACRAAPLEKPGAPSPHSSDRSRKRRAAAPEKRTVETGSEGIFSISDRIAFPAESAISSLIVTGFSAYSRKT